MTLVPHVRLCIMLAGPAPSGSTRTSRRCQGCSHPPQRLLVQAALGFTYPAATGHRRRSCTSSRADSASWRTHTRLNRSSNRRPGSSAAQPWSLACISDTRWLLRGRPGRERRRSAARLSALQSPSPSNRCRPSPCDRLSRPRSTTATPPHPARSADGAPIPTTDPDGGQRGVITGQFPCSLWFARSRRSPALPLRPRHSYTADLHHGLPGNGASPTREVPHRRVL